MKAIFLGDPQRQIGDVYEYAAHTLCDGSVLVELLEQPFTWWAIASSEEEAKKALVAKHEREVKAKQAREIARRRAMSFPRVSAWALKRQKAGGAR